MIYVVPFQAEHVFEMEIQPDQKWIQDYLDLQSTRTLENEWASTLMEDGVPIACAGPIVYWTDRALMWSYIGTGVTRNIFIKLHSIAKEYLAGLPFRRLEAAVDCDFKAGHRWVLALGFKKEASRMEAFQIDGRDCTLYAKVRK